MGLLDLLSPALTVATNAAGTYQNAQAQGNQAKMQGVIQAVQLARQQRQAEIENIKNLADANKANAEAGTYTPEFAGKKAGAEAAATLPYKVLQAQQDLQNHLTELRQSGANEMQVAAARLAGEKAISDAQIQAAASRQSNQQGFEQGQQQRQQQFQTGQTQQQYHNKIGEIGAQGNNSVMTSVGRKLGILQTPPTPQQSDYDDAAQHLQATQPDVDPSTVLGPRP